MYITIITPVDVTQDHIDLGEPENCRSCPIALAIAEASGHPAAVYPDRVEAVGRRWWLDDTLTSFIERYDAGWCTEPRSSFAPVQGTMTTAVHLY